MGYFSVKGEGKISVIDSKMNAENINILLENLKSSVVSLERSSDYFSSWIIIPCVQLNQQRSGCLKIMLMFWNGQVSPQIWIQLGTCGNFWKFKSKKEQQHTSIIWIQYAKKNGTKYLLIIARDELWITGRD